MTVQAMSLFFALLTIAVDVMVVGSLALLVLGSSHTKERLRAVTRDLGLQMAFGVALTATLGSLYYSEVANYVPCKLCWYQRIAMYPMALILGIAVQKQDHAVRRYVLPLSLVGAAISIYHYVLQRFPSLESTSCDPTAPCTTTWVWQFHLISIPFMALSGFAFIAMAMYLMRPGAGSERSES
jgi:disulfide bond formation protein DsbB